MDWITLLLIKFSLRRPDESNILLTVILPSGHPSIMVINVPTILPSYHPTILPSYHATMLPCYHATMLPSYHPTVQPSYHPITSYYPTIQPSWGILIRKEVFAGDCSLYRNSGQETYLFRQGRRKKNMLSQLDLIFWQFFFDEEKKLCELTHKASIINIQKKSSLLHKPACILKNNLLIEIMLPFNFFYTSSRRPIIITYLSGLESDQDK